MEKKLEALQCAYCYQQYKQALEAVNTTSASRLQLKSMDNTRQTAKSTSTDLKKHHFSTAETLVKPLRTVEHLCRLLHCKPVHYMEKDREDGVCAVLKSWVRRYEIQSQSKAGARASFSPRAVDQHQRTTGRHQVPPTSSECAGKA